MSRLVPIALRTACGSMALLMSLMTPAGCDREALDPVCPPLAAGELVVSELRGKQTGDDFLGQWIEIYNPTTSSIALAGLTVRLTRLDGGAEAEIVVRSGGIDIAPGGYVVLGRYPADSMPTYADYGFQADFDKDLYPDGIVELLSCGTLIDRVIYRDLPTIGSFGFDGNVPPDAAANDDEAAWCVDDGPLTGSPGEVNGPCS